MWREAGVNRLRQSVAVGSLEEKVAIRFHFFPDSVETFFSVKTEC